MRNPAVSPVVRISVIALSALAYRHGEAEPAYTYKLLINHDADVCAHMAQVFNGSFSHIWDSEPLVPPYYSAVSKYAFPSMAGVVHNDSATFVMRYSRVPTSPEFSAIDWREGRATLGGCPAGFECPAGAVPIPVLIAHFDFDNDGTVDTVVKESFYAGSLFAGLGAGGEEYLIVWRNQDLSLEGVPVLWDLEHPQDQKNTPVMAAGTQLRPFVYKNRTYVAKYDRQPMLPADAKKERMTVVRYAFSGATQGAGRPIWDETTECQFAMVPQPAVSASPAKPDRSGRGR